MSYNNNTPEFMAKTATTYVNERFDITDKQSEKLKEIKNELVISPSAIVRLAFNLTTHLPYCRGRVKRKVFFNN